MDLNHAMVYVADVGRALDFYRTKLGLTLLEGAAEWGYARLRFPSGNGTIALHAAEGDNRPGDGGIRLYFEVRDLDAFCDALKTHGVVFEKLPADMPWGWRHAYLRDPDGHQLSLYYAGDRRLNSSAPPTLGVK